METKTAPAAENKSAEYGVLNATHRCDKCGARAYIKMTMYTGSLFWCGHHWKEVQQVVPSEGILELIDETEKLTHK